VLKAIFERRMIGRAIVEYTLQSATAAEGFSFS